MQVLRSRTGGPVDQVRRHGVIRGRLLPEIFTDIDSNPVCFKGIGSVNFVA